MLSVIGSFTSLHLAGHLVNKTQAYPEVRVFVRDIVQFEMLLKGYSFIILN